MGQHDVLAGRKECRACGKSLRNICRDGEERDGERAQGDSVRRDLESEGVVCVAPKARERGSVAPGSGVFCDHRVCRDEPACLACPACGVFSCEHNGQTHPMDSKGRMRKALSRDESDEPRIEGDALGLAASALPDGPQSHLVERSRRAQPPLPGGLDWESVEDVEQHGWGRW